MGSVSIKIFPAKGGDCFLLNIGRYHILIDGGYADTYRNHLKKELLSLAEKGVIINLLIITHIDHDHISGILEFLSDNGQSESPEIIQISDVWHNSYHTLPNVQKAEGVLSEKESRLLQGYIDNHFTATDDGYENISSKQGVTVSIQLLNGHYNVNNNSGTCICVEKNSVVDISDKVKIRIISPSLLQLDSLRKKWEAELNSRIWSFKKTGDPLMDSAMEAFLSKMSPLDINIEPISAPQSSSLLTIPELASITGQPDTSEMNASSIAFILEGLDKKILFLGDAHEDQIITEIRKLQLRNGYTPYFDAIKVAHHGSIKNADKLFNLIDGKYFIFSTDGQKHKDHPSLETIAKIIVRPTKIKRILVFNYKNAAFNYYNNKDFMDKYNYNVLLNSSPEDICL